MAALLFYWLTKILVFLFLAGIAGSAVVIVITFFEDGKVLLEPDEPKLRVEPEKRVNASAKAREAY